MQHFMLGCVVGVILTASVNALAGKDTFGRSPQQQQYDYFRQRQMWLDIGQMRQQMDRQEADRKLGKKPC
ncbi:MAG: hypothetical protein AB7G68_00115 [Nitrospiraceae bacterium]